jgi:perosamine synthetase
VQLRKLDAFVAERHRWAEYYRSELSGLEWLQLPGLPRDGQHAWQSFVTLIDSRRAPMGRDAIMDRLKAAGIATRPGTHAVHLLGYYRDRYGLMPDDYPGAKACHEHSMAIPLHNRMTPDDYARVVGSLKSLCH